jgi:membrane protease YdiL (CAAX protease family)
MGERPAGWLVRFWRWFVLAPLRQAEAESRALSGPEADAAGRKALVILISAAFLLTIHFYCCRSDGPANIQATLRRLPGGEELGHGYLSLLNQPLFANSNLAGLCHWAVGSVVVYLLLPALLIRLVYRERLAGYGLKFRGAFADGWVYLVMFAVMGPLVWLVSRQPEFQETYPFLALSAGEPLWPKFWIWEALYACQFLALEFFFRGFLVHGLRPKFGAYAIPIMTIPYCMIHFYGKPFLESLASIVAGLALGFMSLRTRSVLLGAAIHVSVALSMDFASLWRKGYFG